MKIALVLVLVAIPACEARKPAAEQPAATPAEATAARPGDGWQTVAGDAKLPATLASFARDALAAGKKPYAYLHADWCGPCKAIENTRASDPHMVGAFEGTAIATVDIDAADPATMTSLGLETKSIPVFFKLAATGKPTGDRIDGGAWGDNTPENMAPPLKAFFTR